MTAKADKKAKKAKRKGKSKSALDRAAASGKSRLKSKCCFKWRKKSKACSRCPLVAVVGEKTLQHMARKAVVRGRTGKDLATEITKRRRAA